MHATIERVNSRDNTELILYAAVNEAFIVAATKNATASLSSISMLMVQVRGYIHILIESYFFHSSRRLLRDTLPDLFCAKIYCA
jgi:hypothetical protein